MNAKNDNEHINKLLAEIKLLKIENEELLISRNNIFRELEKYQGFKRQLKMLLVLLYQRLILKAESIAFVAQSSYPAFGIIKTDNRQKLLDELQNYDKIAFSEKRVLGPVWRRALSRTLIIMLKIPKIMLKKMYRILIYRKALGV